MAGRPSFTITPVRSTSDLQDTIALFYAYVEWLGIDLAFQNFDLEMSSMPGQYAPPDGELFLARNLNGVAIGCVGLRPRSENGVCEMKRLYVTPEGRGTGVGKALATAAIETAERLGYTEMRLDTLPSMAPALGIYRGLGFVNVDPYYETPIQDTLFMSLQLPRE